MEMDVSLIFYLPSDYIGVINPAFDITSCKLIAGDITEKEVSYYPRKIHKKII